LETDAEMAAALERELREAARDEVAADDRDGPDEVRAFEHLEIRVERLRRRRQTEAHAARAAAEVVEIAAEIQLDKRARGKAAGAPVRERRPEEAGLEDRDARSEPVPLAQLDRGSDVGEAVLVDEIEGAAGETVRVEAAEVH